MPFPYPLSQPSLPPLFPPLPQEPPFFPGQPFLPCEFFNFNPTEDFSIPPHLGMCPHNFPAHLFQPLLEPPLTWSPVSRWADRSQGLLVPHPGLGSVTAESETASVDS